MSKRSTKKSLRKSNQILSFSEFILENNIERSTSGLGKFGMLDKDKFPPPLKKKMDEMGFKKIEAYKAGLDNVVYEEVYTLELDREDEFSVTMFITEELDRIGLAMYHWDKDRSVWLYSEWDKYQSMIKFLDGYDIKTQFIQDIVSKQRDELDQSAEDAYSKYGFDDMIVEPGRVDD